MAVSLQVFCLASILLIQTTHYAVAAPQNNPLATFKNPVFDLTWPDPYVYLHTDGFYYMTRKEVVSIALYKSSTLSNFRTAERQVIYTAPDGLLNLWAPEMHYLEGNWYVYFALDDGENRNHRMYVIRCQHFDPMTGVWSTEQRMRVPSEDFWAIDGTVLVRTIGNNTRLYFLWSGWPHLDADFPQNLYIAPMSDPTTISGPRVLLREPEASWETIAAPIIEGPQIIHHMNRTFVVYSASGSWTADYCLGMIGIDDEKNPLVKENWFQDVDGPVFWRNNEQGVYGVGHASFTTSPDGSQAWIIYHAMADPNGGWGNRTSRIQEFGWNADHSPAFPRPTGLDMPLEAPSGE